MQSYRILPFRRAKEEDLEWERIEEIKRKNDLCRTKRSEKPNLEQQEAR